MQNLEWYLADLKSTGKNTLETVETCLLDWLGYIFLSITVMITCHFYLLFMIMITIISHYNYRL